MSSRKNSIFIQVQFFGKDVADLRADNLGISGLFWHSWPEILTSARSSHYPFQVSNLNGLCSPGNWLITPRLSANLKVVCRYLPGNKFSCPAIDTAPEGTLQILGEMAQATGVAIYRATG